MVDFVGVLESFAVAQGFRFSYGNKANQNLIYSDLVAGRIYLLLDPITRQKSFSENGGEGIKTFSGSFLFGVKADMDKTYYNQESGETFENNTEALEGGFVVPNTCDPNIFNEGKYGAYIKDLLENQLTKIEDAINCSEYQINSWSIVDAINQLDINLDGLIVTFNVSIL